MSVLLLVEGIDDYHTIRNLVSARGLGTCDLANRNSGPDFAFEVIEGYPSSIEASLLTILRSSSTSRFGIIADADANPAISRWHSISGYLRNLEEKSTRLFEDLPQSPSESGLLLATNTGRIVGVWIWPDNVSPGDMETFATSLVPDGDANLKLAEEVLGTVHQPHYRDVHRSKALLHTWLAWQDPPGKPIGTAIQARILKHESPAAESFLAWLTKLKETNP